MHFIQVNIEDLSSFDNALANNIYKNPSEFIQRFEEAITEVAVEVTSRRPDGKEEIQDIQVRFSFVNTHITNSRNFSIFGCFVTGMVIWRQPMRSSDTR